MIENAGLQRLSVPLSFFYGATVSVRARLYRSGVLPRHRPDARVISVGNLTVGGTGKTPIVIAIARRLSQRERVAVVTRGYGGRARGPVILNVETARDRTAAGGADPMLVGDEACLLGRRLPGIPIVVGRNRPAAARAAVDRCGAATLILDDGFQRLDLERDLDLLLLDATNPVGNGRLFPAGPLREPLSAAGRATAVLVTRVEQAPATHARGLLAGLRVPILDVEFGLTALIGVPDGKERPIDDLKGRPVFILCGLGNPPAFRRSLEAAGARVAGEIYLRDHHIYHAGDLTRVERAVAGCGAEMIVTTEKDAVKLERLPIRPGPPLWAARIEPVRFEPGEQWEGLLGI